MMEYQTWSQRKFWLVLVGVLFFGMILSPKGADTQVASQADTKPEVVTKTQVKEVKVEDTARLDSLNAIDQEIFSLNAEVIGAQSTALQAAGTLIGQYPFVSVEEIEAATDIVLEQTERVKTASGQLEPLQAKRSELLGK